MTYSRLRPDNVISSIRSRRSFSFGGQGHMMELEFPDGRPRGVLYRDALLDTEARRRLFQCCR